MGSQRVGHDWVTSLHLAYYVLDFDGMMCNCVYALNMCRCVLCVYVSVNFITWKEYWESLVGWWNGISNHQYSLRDWINLEQTNCSSFGELKKDWRWRKTKGWLTTIHSKTVAAGRNLLICCFSGEEEQVSWVIEREWTAWNPSCCPGATTLEGNPRVHAVAKSGTGQAVQQGFGTQHQVQEGGLWGSSHVIDTQARLSVKLLKESWPLLQLCKQTREEETHEISLLQLPFVHRTVMWSCVKQNSCLRLKTTMTR